MEKNLHLFSIPLKKGSRRKRLPKDRLSSLPDDILLSILSLLTFKEVVKTSLLSRRWLNLWIHSVALQIHAPTPKDLVPNDKERRHFVRLVNRVLRRHKGHYLKEFKIVCDLNKRNQKNIDNWLVFAFAKKVECLELNLLRSRLPCLCSNYDFLGRCNQKNIDNWLVFAFVKKVEYLELNLLRSKLPCLCRNYDFLGRFLNFGGGKADNLDGVENQFLQFDLKCLKSLSLKSVDVTSEAINFVLLNCPFLERLELVGSLKFVNLVISDPTLVLKYLKIKHCFDLKVVDISNFNLVSLDITSIEDLTLTDLPMLVELFIAGASHELTHTISRASSYFFQLEALMLKGYGVEDVTQLPNYDELTKLKRLTIQVGAWNDESLIQVFISIIKSCPHLEEFVLMLNWYWHERTARNKIREAIRYLSGRSDIISSSSPLKNKSIKVFEFWGYYGRVCHDELIRHVVANAVGLEKIIIDPRDSLDIDRYPYRTEAEEEARTIAWQHYEVLKGFIPPHVHLHIR